ncbi:MAG TPA: 6-phosphogluconolactonase, partial [Nitrospirota bacterium]
GAGADGHTASLFPGSAAIQERTRLAVPVLKRVPEKNRITITLPVLNNAAHVLFLASGPQKASVVREIFENGNARGFPAGLVQPVSGSLEWFIDRSAASGSRSLSGG